MARPMKTPRYTDQHRYPRGYTPARETDIRRTFEQARLEQEEAARRTAAKVKPIKKASA
jgi:hypothetical protein